MFESARLQTFAFSLDGHIFAALDARDVFAPFLVQTMGCERSKIRACLCDEVRLGISLEFEKHNVHNL